MNSTPTPGSTHGETCSNPNGSPKSTRLKRWLLLALYQVLLVSLLMLLFLDLFPSMVGKTVLAQVPYFAARERYVPHDQRVMRYRANYMLHLTGYKGDLFKPEYGVDAVPFDYSARFNADGFRIPPEVTSGEVAVIGDSYIEFGTDDADTFTQRLQNESGLSVLNFGHGWYGPNQYVHVLQEVVPAYKPRFALLCFFEGNDLDDVAQYQQFLLGHPYYHFNLHGKNLLERMALSAVAIAQIPLSRPSQDSVTGAGLHPDLVSLELAGQQVLARFQYGIQTTPPLLLRQTPVWQDLEKSFQAFRDTCEASQIQPVVVFIPHKAHVYASYVAEAGQEHWVMKKDPLGMGRKNKLKAVQGTCGSMGLPLVDLSEAFDAAASKGMMLYYPFDTHWNAQGRALAAEVVGSWLKTFTEVSHKK